MISLLSQASSVVRSPAHRRWDAAFRGWAQFLWWFSALSLGGVVSCSGDTLNGPPVDVAHAFWTLQFQQPLAINLALTPPYDTVRLSAVARNPLGAPLSGLGTIVYRTTPGDSSVIVDSLTGLVTAHGVTSGTTVTASLRDAQQGLTLIDSVFIQVTATAPPVPFRTFSMQPPAGDSTKLALYHQPYNFWSVTAIDAGGHAVCDGHSCGLLVQYTSSDTAVINTGSLDTAIFSSVNDTGHIYLKATTLAYGQVLQDSVLFTVTSPIGLLVVPTMALINNTEHAVGFPLKKVSLLGVGGVVEWTDYSTGNTTPWDVQFDQPASVDTASCTNGQLENFSTDSLGNPAPFAPVTTGRGNIAAFGGDTTGFQGPGASSSQYTFSPDSSIQYFLPVWFQHDCRARSFPIAGTYHWHSSLVPTDTFTLIVN